MRYAGLFAVPFVASIAAADPIEKTVSKLSILPTTAASSPVEVWLSRTRSDDGGLTIKLTTRSATTKAFSVTLYSGGGDDDGAGDDDLRSVGMRAFDVPGGKRWVRVDFGYHIADGGKRDERTDTYLLDVSGKPRRLLEIKTQQIRMRSKLCREGEETQLVPEIADGEVRLITTTSRVVDPALGDDDEPIDKSCKPPAGAVKTLYRWNNDGGYKPYEPSAAPTPPTTLAPTTAAAPTAAPANAAAPARVAAPRAPAAPAADANDEDD